MVKYLLFDLDRTLWDFDGNAAITFRLMYDKFRLDELCGVSYEEFHRFYFDVNATLWEGYRNGTVTKEQLNIDRFRIPLQHYGMQDCTRLAVQLGDFFVYMGPQQTGLMPGARELLEHLQEWPFALGVVTNGFSEAQWPKMRSSDIHKYFSHFFLSEEVGYMKPDVRFFQEVQRQLGAEAGEIGVVGDDFAVDIVGAQRAAMPQIYYNYRALPLPKGATPPTYEVRHLMEIEELLPLL